MLFGILLPYVTLSCSYCMLQEDIHIDFIFEVQSTGRSIVRYTSTCFYITCTCYFKHILLSYKTRQIDKTQVVNL